MIYTIENDCLSVSVDTLGAQLSSIYSKVTKTEYLWQGDKKYWTGRAYNLFPHVGRSVDGKYLVNGKEYQMDRHGFARGMQFVLSAKTKISMTFCISATDQTKELYPFDFIFFVRFSLKDNRLLVEYKISNVGSEVMYFGLGGHPGFNLPFDGGEFEDYFVEFDEKCVPTQIIANEKGLITTETKSLQLVNDKVIALKHDLFDNDAIIMKDTSKGVSIKSKLTKKSVRVTFDKMAYLGLWHMPKTDAPYLCIEPWMTLPSSDGNPESFETKENIGIVAPDHSFFTEFAIYINE